MNEARVLSISYLQIVSYISFSIFVGGTIAKIYKYATTPVHLRWELYPVPHEKKREDGGSYLEDLVWRAGHHRKSLIGELTYITREALLFMQCYRHNRGLWYFTHPFHVGLFLLTIWLILLFLGAVTELTGVSVSEASNPWGTLIYYLTLVSGIVGLVLGTFGCVGLVIKRAADRNLRRYTAAADYFNLAFVLAVLISGLYIWLFSDPSFYAARAYTESLITFSPVSMENPALSAGIGIFSLFLIYMPFTNMTHAFAKFFTYHRVLWDDEPTLRGSEIERKLQRLFNQRVSWSAPHIQSGNTWGEVVSNVPNANQEEPKGNGEEIKGKGYRQTERSTG
jgi:nitrate reductase gamma subunit